MKSKGIYLSWITVKNIKEAIKFYTEVVGLELKEYNEEFKWAELGGPDGSTLGIGEETPDFDMKAGTNAVVTITVHDLDEAIEHFNRKGATLVGEVLEVPGQVKLQTFMDKDKNTLQLVQQLS